MRTILLAFAVAAATQAAPAAYAACAETHGSKAHLHSGQCAPDSTVFIRCPLPDVVVTTVVGEVGFECD